MPSTCSSDPPLLVYYGRGELGALARHRRVVLQPDHYAAWELVGLAGGGTEALAYLALSEDPSPQPAPWQRRERNPDWGGAHVDVAHPAWGRRVLERAEACLAHGFAGLFLDTLDAPALWPEDREPLLELVGRLRALAGDRYLLANRGLEVHRELAPLVDGFLFEAFSTTWQGGYRALPPAALRANVAWLERLRATGRHLYALDYATDARLAAFARSRARTHGLPVQVADRMLTTAC